MMVADFRGAELRHNEQKTRDRAPLFKKSQSNTLHKFLANISGIEVHNPRFSVCTLTSEIRNSELSLAFYVLIYRKIRNRSPARN